MGSLLLRATAATVGRPYPTARDDLVPCRLVDGDSIRGRWIPGRPCPPVKGSDEGQGPPRSRAAPGNHLSDVPTLVAGWTGRWCPGSATTPEPEHPPQDPPCGSWTYRESRIPAEPAFLRLRTALRSCSVLFMPAVTSPTPVYVGVSSMGAGWRPGNLGYALMTGHLRPSSARPCPYNRPSGPWLFDGMLSPGTSPARSRAVRGPCAAVGAGQPRIEGSRRYDSSSTTNAAGASWRSGHLIALVATS